MRRIAMGFLIGLLVACAAPAAKLTEPAPPPPAVHEFTFPAAFPALTRVCVEVNKPHLQTVRCLSLGELRDFLLNHKA